MVFTSHIFIFYFLPAFLLLYFNFPYRWRNLLITVASYGFYGWWQPWFVVLMMFTTVMDFIWGRVVAAPGATPLQRKGAVLACVATNLAFLGFFKYYMFSVESLNRLLGLVGSDALPILEVILPIGISFYTFHSLTYVIDVYRGHAKAARSFTDFSAFVALFPDLVAGPIIRYHTLADQLRYREHTVPRFASGVAIFILGFAKKVLLANPAGHVADAVFNAADPCAMDAWFGVLAYSYQIYFDFCGYSDMAVGLGRMLGFEYLKNFDAPYLAESITDLWRRWHISLSSVLRDYLYLPLGGNRKGLSRTYVNLAIVMLLGGLWHGAKWTFVLWGAYHGLLLAYERRRGKQSDYQWLPRPRADRHHFCADAFLVGALSCRGPDGDHSLFCRHVRPATGKHGVGVAGGRHLCAAVSCRDGGLHSVGVPIRPGPRVGPRAADLAARSLPRSSVRVVAADDVHPGV